ncbi:MAG: Ig-like domain-containing protein [Burkholderiaceae bacterium]
MVATDGGGARTDTEIKATVPLDNENAHTTTMVVLGAALSVLQFGEGVADRVTAALSDWTDSDAICPSSRTGGNRRIRDRNVPGKPSIGDRIQFSFVACSKTVSRFPATGMVVAEIEALDVDHPTPTFTIIVETSEAFVFGDTQLPGSAGVRLRVERGGDGSQRWTRVSSLKPGNVDTVLPISVPTGPLALTDGTDIERRFDYRLARYEITMAANLKAPAIGGAVTIRTNRPLSGVFHSLPDRGEFSIGGANDSRLTWLAQADESMTARGVLERKPALEAPARIGIYKQWSELVEPDFWREPRSFLWKQWPAMPNGVWPTRLLFVEWETPMDPRPRLILQFSHPLDSTTALSFAFEDLSIGNGLTIPAIVTADGARVLIAPAEQLDHGHRYRVMETAGTRVLPADALEFELTETDSAGFTDRSRIALTVIPTRGQAAYSAFQVDGSTAADGRQATPACAKPRRVHYLPRIFTPEGRSASDAPNGPHAFALAHMYAGQGIGGPTSSRQEPAMGLFKSILSKLGLGFAVAPVHPVRHQAMQVDVQVRHRAKALDQCRRPALPVAQAAPLTQFSADHPVHRLQHQGS